MLRAARVLRVLGKWWKSSGEHLKDCGDVEGRRERVGGLERGVRVLRESRWEERGFVDRGGEERESASMVK